jgi:hypothetical protein
MRKITLIVCAILLISALIASFMGNYAQAAYSFIMYAYFMLDMKLDDIKEKLEEKK